MFLGRFGTWNGALQAAGLEVVARRNVPREELFENLALVWQALGRQPTQADMMRPQSAFSAMPYNRRFGGWLRALKAFVAWSKGGKTAEESSSPQPAAAPQKAPRNPNSRLRFNVLERDSFMCTACGRSPSTDPGTRLDVDHKIPWSRGGQTVLENLATLCQKCNMGKGNSKCRPPAVRKSSSRRPKRRGQTSKGRGKRQPLQGRRAKNK